MAVKQREYLILTFQPFSNRNIVVALSGKGRSLQNLLEQQDAFEYKVVGVICSNINCLGFQIARDSQLPIYVGDYSSDKLAVTHIEQQAFLRKLNASLIVLAGFLRKFPIDAKTDPIAINIHPSLLPKFGGAGFFGMKVHQAVFDAKEADTGATVHLVTDQYDEGAIISRAKVKLSEGDSPEDIGKKVFELEKILLPQTIKLILDQKLPADRIWELA
jgi:folate-dependent phosphoribosylglycinamide formyltransferase PurN